MSLIPLHAIGVMTGNSLDGADLVLSRFESDGTITDLCSYSAPYPEALTHFLREARRVINACRGDMARAVQAFDREATSAPASLASALFVAPKTEITLDNLIYHYTSFVAEAVRSLRARAQQSGVMAEPDVIGFHGQTCAHLPPSIAKSSDPAALYTVQLGDGALLADLTGLTVVYDFRSDDLMRGGEAAPLAPMHHQHIGMQCRRAGHFPIAFLNAGNTGNLSIISHKRGGDELVTLGWDAGPFNHLADRLTQQEKGAPFDRDGRWGLQGTVNLELLRILFERGVRTAQDENFLLLSPPKSSDPEWYRLPGEVFGEASVGNGASASFEDRIRTVEYFAAYCLYFSLSLLPEDVALPLHFALCGGGWKNPVALAHFEALVHGDRDTSPPLAPHVTLFAELRARMLQASGGPGGITCGPSQRYGFDGTVMEARLFADAAVCRLQNEPFTTPSITGVKQPCVLGIIRFPKHQPSRATEAVRKTLARCNSGDPKKNEGVAEGFDGRWSRASAGWHARRSE